MEFAVELRNVSKIFGDRLGAGRAVTAVHQINLAIRPGEFFTLLGPSGCGKTTTLRMIAGFEAVTSGDLLIQGQPMTDVPPNKRPVNTVFQNYALFPHLTVAENVAFGLVVKRLPRAEREQRAEEALELVRLPGLGRRKPSQLSGGQQQRVALARALVNRPAVLLLDEPLGALDLKLRKEMQIELKRLQRQVGVTFIYVTHDQEEALTMSDRIAVMNLGQVLQMGDPVTIYEKPATRFVADFIGETNFLKGTVIHAAEGRAQMTIAGETVSVSSNRQPLIQGQTVTLAVRPEKVSLAPLDEANALNGTVQEVIYIGTDTRYVVRLASGETVVARIQNANGSGSNEPRVGDAVKVYWKQKDGRVLTG
ncbi:MAG: ABC transporter ATP-binding protein [Chloroflexi bacterium]|nr:ABC transporter ATP-binding protein [Chloroflexota bacterium]